MSLRRLSFALMLSASAGFVDIPHADACCLTDWLFGRTTTPYYAGYAPLQTGPLVTTPIVTSNYGGNFAQPYASNYATAYTSQPLLLPAQTNGVFQAQRPAFGQVQPAGVLPLNNPSVYTGMPTEATVQAAYSIPTSYAASNFASPIYASPNDALVTNNYRGAVPVGGSYLGASNTYPRTTIQSNLQTSFQNPAMTTLPATNVAPLFAPAPATGGGLGQFFGSLFGTNYRSSYYQAPVTYYRPVTSVDPMSGTTVTMQQPCTSEITQVQRSPYSSLFAGPSAPIQSTPIQSAPIQYGTPTYTLPSDCNQPMAYGSPSGQSGVAQTGAFDTAPGQFTVPIPSTAPQMTSPYAQQGFEQQGFSGANAGTQPMQSPLTGSPTQPRSQSNGDMTPLEQPRLETYRAPEANFAPPPTTPQQAAPQQTAPSSDEWYNSDRYLAPPKTEPIQPTTPDPTPKPAPKSFWQLQDSDDSTAMIRPESTPRPVMTPPSFTAAEPIRALDPEPSPFELRDAAKASPATSNFQAPPLPPATTYDPFGNSRADVRPTRPIPVREAALVREQSKPVAPPAPIEPSPIKPTQRDARWFTN